MESNSDQKSIVEELKAAGEELKKTEREEVLKSEEPRSAEVNQGEWKEGQSPPVEKSASPQPQKLEESSPPGWISFQFYQKEISSERQRLERAYKETESWQRKIQERLGTIKELTDQSEKINKELEKFQQKITLVRKENNTLLFQIKDKSSPSIDSGS